MICDGRPSTRCSLLAQTWELVPRGRNPCKTVRHYREQSRERFLTPGEYRSVGAALREVEANGSIWPPAIAALRLLMPTGCRKSEILTLRWNDVDRTAGEFRLHDGKPGPRMVPLTTPALKVLDGIERVEGIPWVIRIQKPGISMPGLNYYWNRIQNRVGLEAVRIHDLRHSSASYQRYPAPISTLDDYNALIQLHFLPSAQAA